MKKVVVLVILLSSTQIFAQYGRQQRRNRQISRPPVEAKPIKFNAQKEAGAFVFEMEELYKKVKIKPESKDGQILKKYIRAYNDSIENIQIMYKTTFREIDLIVETKKAELKNSRNPEVMKSIQSYLKANLDPIKEMVDKIEANLTTSLKENLSEKPHEKWTKYKRKYKTKQYQARGR